MMAPPPIAGTLMDIVVWLRSLGLGKYEAAFRENEIDETVLPEPDGGGPEGAWRHQRWASPEAAGCYCCVCAPIRA